MTKRPALALALLLLTAAPAGADTLSGTAAAVDPVTVEIAGTAIRLRDIGIPPTATATWKPWLAKLLLSSVVGDGVTACEGTANTGWRCTTAQGLDVGSQLVQAGQALAGQVGFWRRFP